MICEFMGQTEDAVVSAVSDQVKLYKTRYLSLQAYMKLN